MCHTFQQKARRRTRDRSRGCFQSNRSNFNVFSHRTMAMDHPLPRLYPRSEPFSQSTLPWLFFWTYSSFAHTHNSNNAHLPHATPSTALSRRFAANTTAGVSVHNRVGGPRACDWRACGKTLYQNQLPRAEAVLWSQDSHIASPTCPACWYRTRG